MWMCSSALGMRWSSVGSAERGIASKFMVRCSDILQSQCKKATRRVAFSAAAQSAAGSYFSPGTLPSTPFT